MAEIVEWKEDALSHRVIGAAISVHRALGPGFLELVYESAMALELTAINVPFVRQHAVTVTYRGINVGEGRTDFIVDQQLIVELKAVDTLAPIHEAQLISYLRATGIRRGLLLNFNVVTLKDCIRRILH